MMLESIFVKPLERPIQTLAAVFVAWKTLLILVALCSPGPGYDTSTSLNQLQDGDDYSNPLLQVFILLCKKLTRWDAIYYTKVAYRGYLYEQEWAFGWGFTRIIAFFANDIREIGLNIPLLESIVGVSVAHAAHGLSVVVLYYLARALFPGPSDHKLAFATACLHIVSPAGVFLSAPYGESTFAFLNFLGILLFVKSFSVTGLSSAGQDVCLIASGLVLGSATTIRSNGLLSGLLFLEEALRTLATVRNGLQFVPLRRLVTTGIGGVCIGLGFVLPQYIAYEEYCGHSSSSAGSIAREWCGRRLPSIFTFVQSYYWNVGFLRYWTVSNIPLFLLASPMLAILTRSSIQTMQNNRPRAIATTGKDAKQSRTIGKPNGIQSRLLLSLAVQEFLLAVMALTSYHVQIISRISSGYPMWYLWLASTLIDPKGKWGAGSIVGKVASMKLEGKQVLRYLMMYALIQGGLFSSFLPPA